MLYLCPLRRSFLERFAIFSREQQHLQRVSAKGGNGHDLVSYVEQQRDMRWGGVANALQGQLERVGGDGACRRGGGHTLTCCSRHVYR